jgi:hypothetical protein
LLNFDLRNEDDTFSFWNKAGGDKDGAAGEETAIAAGAIQDGSSRNRSASADARSGVADI